MQIQINFSIILIIIVSTLFIKCYLSNEYSSDLLKPNAKKGIIEIAIYINNKLSANNLYDVKPSKKPISIKINISIIKKFQNSFLEDFPLKSNIFL